MKNSKVLIKIILVTTLALVSSGCSTQSNASNLEVKQIENTSTVELVTSKEEPKDDFFIDTDKYKLIEVDGGNLSGYREPNVTVNIGFGDREYYAFTNEFGQLVLSNCKRDCSTR